MVETKDTEYSQNVMKFNQSRGKKPTFNFNTLDQYQLKEQLKYIRLPT